MMYEFNKAIVKLQLVLLVFVPTNLLIFMNSRPKKSKLTFLDFIMKKVLLFSIPFYLFTAILINYNSEFKTCYCA